MLDNLAMRTGINISKACQLLDDVGYDLTMWALEETAADTTYSKPILFSRKAKEARRKAGRARKATEDTKVHEKRVAAWEDFRKKGFKATPEELQAQLEDLYKQRLLHDYACRTPPSGFDELNYEQQEGVFLALGTKGIQELTRLAIPKPEPEPVAVGVIDDIPF